MPRLELRIREVDFKECAKSKGSNGGVAVGLPHRNYSVFKQTHINQRKVKGRIRMELRIREVDIEASAKPKGSNGGVAVGLPHRNSSVFKQTPYQLMGSKRRGASTSGLTSAAQ